MHGQSSLLGERAFPYRIKKSDIEYLDKNKKEIFTLNQATPNQEMHGQFFERGNESILALLLEALPKLATQALSVQLKDEEEFTEVAKLLTGWEFEAFLFLPPSPVFMVEVYPQITGITTDTYYGSNMIFVLPLSIFSKGMEALGKHKGVARFGSIAFGEKIADIPREEYIKDPSSEGMINTAKETGAMKQRKQDKFLWFINDEKYILTYLINFAAEFAVSQKLISNIGMLIDSPDSRIGREAYIDDIILRKK